MLSGTRLQGFSQAEGRAPDYQRISRENREIERTSRNIKFPES